jgi:hypothetical protein
MAVARVAFVAVVLLALLAAGCIEVSLPATAPTPAPSSSAAPTGDFRHPTAKDTPEAKPTPTGAPAPRPAATGAPEETTSDAGNGSAPADYPEAWTRPPMAPLPDQIRGLELVAEASGVTAAHGIAVFGHYVFAGDFPAGPTWVIDIADPSNPVTVASIDMPTRDADVIAYPDGRLVLVGASGGDAFHIADVTDPTQPDYLGSVTTKHTNHNLVVVPGTALVYNSPSSGSMVDIWDLTDPSGPQLVLDWDNRAGCHDATFHIDPAAGLYRGYCAGIDVIQIWDVTDPRDPQVITEVPFPLAGQELTGGVSPASFAHLAMPNHDATVLIVGDETGGGLAPACDVYADAAGTTVSGPLGNVWFYDIKDERNPVLKGHVSPGAIDGGTSCTAHFGREIQDTNVLAMSFYTAGIALIDFNDLDNPRILDLWRSGSHWDVWEWQGMLYTGDRSNGVQVLRLV